MNRHSASPNHEITERISHVARRGGRRIDERDAGDFRARSGARLVCEPLQILISMGKVFSILFGLTLFGTNAAAPQTAPASAAEDYFAPGDSLARAGDWQAALELWQEGWRTLQKNSKSDPRIAFAFIALATQEKDSSRYTVATEMYDWAFSYEFLVSHEAAIEQELARLAPIIDTTTAGMWQALLQSRDASLGERIKRFWRFQDPTPSTIRNERLIEHWERIAKARKELAFGRYSIYGTDDRGLIYVKYGEPDRGFAINLGEGKMFPQPRCEIWFYAGLNAENEVYFIFDEKGRQVDSIEDIIDQVGKVAGGGYHMRQGAVGAAKLQLVYYKEIMGLHPDFARRFEEVETLLERTVIQAEQLRQSVNVQAIQQALLATRNRFRVEDREFSARNFAPPSRSRVDEALEPIPIFTTMGRFLDRNNLPILRFVTFAFPEGLSGVTEFDLLENRESPDYRLAYTLLVHDSHFVELQRVPVRQLAAFDNTAVATIRHLPQQDHYSFAVEAFPTESSAGELQPIAASHNEFSRIDLLDADPAHFEVSDLIIGIAPPDDLRPGTLPFPVVPTQNIWQPDMLQVYLEVYHLSPGDAAAAGFTIDFSVARIEKIGDRIKRKEAVASAFSFQSAGPTAKESFAIDISNLKPARYELSVEITNRASGEKKQRTREFEVMKVD